MLLSPENTKLGACPLELLKLLLLLELELELDDARKSIQGTATCLPPLEDRLLPEELPLGLVLPPAALDEPKLLEDPDVPDELPAPEELPLGLVLLPELLPPELLELNDSTAKSMRPEVGLIIVSLTVPSDSPEEPVTVAPINWLPRIS